MRFALQAGLVVRSGLKTFEVVRQLPDGDWQLEDMQTRRPRTYKEADLLNKIWDGKYVVMASPCKFGASEAKPTDSKVSPAKHVAIASLTEKAKEAINYRLQYVEALSKHGISRGQRQAIGSLIEKFAAKIGDETPPSTSAVMAWARAYERAGCSVLALLSGNQYRATTRRLNAEVERVIAAKLRTVYFTRLGHSLRHTADQVQIELNRLAAAGEISREDATVSEATLSRRAREVDAYQRIASREGACRARMVCRTTFDGGGASYPLQRVEVDHTLLDWVVICDRTGLPLGRPMLTVAVDAFSSYVLGYYVSFYGPGLTSVSGAIESAVRRKSLDAQRLGTKHDWLSHGLADEFLLDNGMEFHAHSFKQMAWSLGSHITYCRVRTPWLKPHVERFFANLKFLSLKKGRVQKRVANALNVDPYKDASITFSDLITGFMQFIVDVYPFEINERKLARPYDLFREGMERCPPAEFPGSWQDLRLASALSKVLTVGPGGVETHGLSFGDGRLLDMRRRYGQTFKTLVKWNPDDISVFHVQDPQTKAWVVAPCRQAEYVEGLSWNQHLLIQKFSRSKLKKSGAYEHLLEARTRLHEHWANATRSTRRADSLLAGRYAGHTSSKMLAAESTVPELIGAADRPTLVAQEEIAAVPHEIPKFEVFRL
jgi:putative transposase